MDDIPDAKHGRTVGGTAPQERRVQRSTMGADRRPGEAGGFEAVTTCATSWSSHGPTHRRLTPIATLIGAVHSERTPGELVNRPLLFLDVDGPLNPYAAQPERRPDGYTTIRVPRNDTYEGDGGFPFRRRPLRVWLNPEHGRVLLHLGFELCWATTWMDDANRWIAPVLGLPELPFVDFGDVLRQERPDGVHWKTGPLVDYAGGRPFAWVDDEQSDLDRAYVAAHHQGPGLLHHVNPRIGLRENDFRALADFADSPHTWRANG